MDKRLVHGAYLNRHHQLTAQTQEQQHDNAQEPVQRSGFIDVKNLSSINDLTTPVFDSAQKANIVEEVNFERALEESMQNPKTEVVEKVDTASDFEGYLHSYNPAKLYRQPCCHGFVYFEYRKQRKIYYQTIECKTGSVNRQAC